MPLSVEILEKIKDAVRLKITRDEIQIHSLLSIRSHIEYLEDELKKWKDVEENALGLDKKIDV